MARILKRILERGTAAAEAEPAFQVACACGHTLTGQRGSRHQVLPCPACARKVFVLGKSPLPPPHREGRAAVVASGPRLRRRDWSLILGVATVALGALVAAYFLFLHERPPGPIPNYVNEEDLLATAQKLLAQGSYRLALAELAKGKGGATLRPEKERSWRQLAREAALLADLLAESLEDIIANAAGTAPEEWEQEFAARYVGKAVVLDAAASRAGKGGYALDYPLLTAAPARIAVDDLQLLNDWGQDGRLIFGARLGSLRVEVPGPAWVVRFQPNSGVLLTQAEAASLSCPAFALDDARQVFAKQQHVVLEKLGLGLKPGRAAKQ